MVFNKEHLKTVITITIAITTTATTETRVNETVSSIATRIVVGVVVVDFDVSNLHTKVFKPLFKSVKRVIPFFFLIFKMVEM